MGAPKILVHDHESNARRIADKIARHAEAYRTDAAAFLRGSQYHTVIIDELKPLPPYERFIPDWMTHDERAWLIALRKELGAQPEMYEVIPAAQRRQLEAYYLEMSTHDSRKGRRAQRVVRTFVEYKLGDTP